MASRTIKLADSVVALGAVVIVARLTRSPLLTLLVNTLLTRAPGLVGSVRRVDLSLIEPKITLYDLSLSYPLKKIEQHLEMPTFELEADWKQLVRGTIGARVRIGAACLRLSLRNTADSRNDSLNETPDQRAANSDHHPDQSRSKSSSWQEKIERLPSIKLDCLTLADCAVRLEIISGIRAPLW